MLLLLLLQQSMSDEERPPLPALLTILKEGFKAYEATRSALLDEDEEDGRTADPNALQQDCPDKHEKCPFWAHIVGSHISLHATTTYTSCLHCDLCVVCILYHME